MMPQHTGQDRVQQEQWRNGSPGTEKGVSKIPQVLIKHWTAFTSQKGSRKYLRLADSNCRAHCRTSFNASHRRALDLLQEKSELRVDVGDFPG